ncbi:MAG: preprotein translocase subunit SecY, partial [Miltoncostaeaceae bacterium]|nr:preprotein translocase subunit SecY [Miltoncostaeaceae bacterium]
MLSALLNSFKVPELRKKLLFTFGMLALYRLGTFVPVPGVDLAAVKQAVDARGNANVLNFLNLFSGGA